MIVQPATHDGMFAVLVAVWLSGVLVFSVRLLTGWWEARRLQRTGLTAPASAWQTVCDRLAVRLRLRRHVHVVESSGIEVPSVIGWWRPVLLLPITAFSGLTPTQAEAVLIHELAHIRRHDYFVNMLQRLTETVLFYHPAVWWISHRMRIEREQCCDAVAVRLCGDARDYAAALLHLEEGRGRNVPRLAVAATGGTLADRIRRILRPHAADRGAFAPGVVTIVTVLAFVLIVSGGYRRLLEARSQSTSVIATVNGESVTQADLDHFRPFHNESANTPMDRVLVQTIDERLLVQRARALGFTFELRPALAELKQEMHIATDAALDARLAKQRLTRSDLEEHLRRWHASLFVAMAEANHGFVVDDDEAKAYFDSHLDEFPLQTFDLVKPALLNRLTWEHLARGIVPAPYIQPLRAAATIVWKNADLERTYANELAVRPQAQVGTPVPGRPTTPTPEWHVTTTDHFHIFATSDVATQVNRVQQFAEQAYQHLSSDLRHDLDVRPTLVLFATGAGFRTATAATLPNASTPSQRTVLLLDQSDAALKATVMHEVAHAFEFNIVPRATLAAAPRWIVEGLSEYEGAAWGASDRALLQNLVRTGTVPSLSSVDATQGNPRLVYSLGHAAFDFIATRWGIEGIRQLLVALRNGHSDPESIFMAAWHVRADDVDREFAAYLVAHPYLPQCLEEGGLVNVDLKEVTIPQVLTFLGRSCGIEVRLEGIPDDEAAKVLPRVQFNQAKISEIVPLILSSAGWHYTVLDEKTLVLSKQ